MNLSHFKTVVGILKLASLITCLLAAAIGTSAFVTSEYNKSCGDVDSSIVVPTDPSSGGSSSTPIFALSLNVFSGSSKVNAAMEQEQITTEVPELAKDMAPVLWMERFQISTTCIAFIISLILLILFVVKESMEYSKYFKTVNFAFHFLFCVLHILSAIFIGFAAVEIDKQICQNNFDKREDCQKYRQKMVAAAFTLLTAVLYAAISIKSISSKLYEEV